MCRQIRLFSGWTLALLLGVGWMPMGTAQRLLVVSQSRNALGEATRLQVHNVDLDHLSDEPGPLPLAGAYPTAPLLLDKQQAGLIVSSGSEPSNPAPMLGALAGFHVAPLAPWQNTSHRTPPGTREWAVAIIDDQRTLSNLLVTVQASPQHSSGDVGALVSRPWPPEGIPGHVQAAGTSLPLPLSPYGVFHLGTMKFLIVARASGGAPLSLFTADLARDSVSTPVTWSPEIEGAEQAQLGSIIVDPQGTHCWALFSAITLGDSGATPRSWLYEVAVSSLTPIGSPLELDGLAMANGSSLTADADGVCWVATHVPGTGYAEITRVRRSTTESAPEKDGHWALVGVQQQIIIAPDTQSEDVMVAFNDHLEYWPGGEGRGQQHTFEAPLAAVHWSEGRVMVAEGNRVHRVVLPEATPEATVALTTGWAVDFMPLPDHALPTPDGDGDGLTDDAEIRLQTKPDMPDSDGDGIPDGRDPHPNAPSPRVQVAADLVFPYATVGRQLRALQIEIDGEPNAQWHIDYDEETLPWLRIQPRDSRGSGYAYLGVDPELFDPAGVVSGVLTVTVSGKPKGNRPGYIAAGSPATVQVRVAPPRDPLPTILWLWPESAREATDPRPLSKLAALLAESPYYFSHVSRYGPVSENLTPYSIIILGARAAAEGALTQKALLDYLNDGGALLFLGEHLEGDQFRDLSTWLRPLDFKIEMETSLSGHFPGDQRVELLQHWDDFSLRNGTAFVDQRPDSATVRIARDPGDSLVFAARPHGYGRVALLAAPTPFGDEALLDRANHSFALDLFYWLRRAGYAVSDRDGDGILDEVETISQRRAAGEGRDANWLVDPDSDRDGIPDGMEDVNRNGVIDPGETDPRNADTDGDGTPDGADATPTGLVG